MKKNILFLIIFFLTYIGQLSAQRARMLPDVTPAGKGKVNTRVDNIGYWTRMVRLGYVKPDTAHPVSPARFTGTMILPYTYPEVRNPKSEIRNPKSSFPPQNSPDIPVTGETDVTQSENSVFIDPADEEIVLNSNNSSSWISGFAQDPYGADGLYSFNGGQAWEGSVYGINGDNGGDPATAIGVNGWWYSGRINGSWGQSVSYSKDQGNTWKKVNVGAGPTVGIGLLDKNHLWIDNTSGSPFSGYLYAAWTNFIPGSADTNQIEFVRSANQGLSWSSPYNISTAASALKINHGVNIHTGPDGAVYVAWSIYDAWPSDETAIGFARSIDGGGIFTPATRIISNIKGIRATMTGKNMRVNSFPSMAVDNSTGPNRGAIFIVWSNVGFPGINTGTDIDIYLIKSENGGTSWSAPVRVNQDPAGLGKQHFFPWITCDPVTGGLCVIYYDDRNLPATDAAAFVSYSYDGGLSWTDMQVSDFSFTPDPIPGLAFSYFGDYIGIQSLNMKVYPVWTDNHQAGRPMTYVSPFDLGPNPNQPWVTYYSNTLTPVFGGGSTGMNFGDSLHLSLGLKNIGDQPAINVLCRLSTGSPYIQMTDSTGDYGTILPGEVKTISNGFTFKVSDTIPDNLKVRFNVQASDADSTWFSHFSTEAHAPALKINGVTIVDTPGGNLNGRMDPGETVSVVIATANTGDFTCYSTYGLLSTTSPYLTLVSDSIYLDSIMPGQVKNAVFGVTVSAGTPAGSGADLHYTASSGLYSADHSFRQMIGLVAEDWETNTFTKFPWQTSGNLPWTLTGVNPWEGSYCARSGAIPDNKNSQLFISYNSVNDDSISFYMKTSSEEGYDFLMFSIDAVLRGQWSGDTPWTRVAFPVDAGLHTFKWTYLKDLALSWGEDCAWVDFIALPPPVLPVVDPGPGDTICAGRNVFLQATATNYDSIKWTTTGDGFFSSDTSLITMYIPGTGDLVTGEVSLRLTGYSSYGSYSQDKPIHIDPRPVAAISVFPKDTVCAGQPVLLSADTAAGLTYHWTPGNLSNSEVQYDTSNTGGLGTHMVRLSVMNQFQCVSLDSVYLTFKNCTAIEENDGFSTMIYPNPGDGRFILELNTCKPGPLHLSVANTLGEAVFHEDALYTAAHLIKKINLTFLPDGIYLLTITTACGTTSSKLIIRK